MTVEYHFNKNFDFKSRLKDKKYSIQFLPRILHQESTMSFIDYKGKKLKSTYLVDIVHNLILKYYLKKENSFNISSIVLKEKYGHIYNFYMDYLSEKKIIILVKNYLKGKNARIYKLNDSVLKGQINRFKNTDKVLIKKYKNAISLVERDQINNCRILPEVKTKLVDDLFFVNIDFSQAIFFLDSTIQDKDTYNKNKYSVECIDNKHIFYHFDSYGRMHTNFTILRSYIRKNCLRIEDESVCEVDIKNSQPLFLIKVIEMNKDILVDSDEFEFYKALTKSGNFYQYMIDNTEIKDKKNIKEGVYKVLFGKNYKNKYDDMFQKLFPSIYNFIKVYKKVNKDYRILSHTLQNLESDLIYNKIIKEIMSEYPQIRLLTVHDSLICSEKYKDVIKNIFKIKMDAEFGSNNYSTINIYSYA
jgi:hypothetical protein